MRPARDQHPVTITNDAPANDAQTGAEGVAAPARTPATDSPSQDHSNRRDATTSGRAALLAMHRGGGLESAGAAPIRALLVATMGAVLAHDPPTFGRRSKTALLHAVYATMTDVVRDDEQGLHIVEGCAAELAGATSAVAAEEFRRLANGTTTPEDSVAHLWNDLAARWGELLPRERVKAEGEGA